MHDEHFEEEGAMVLVKWLDASYHGGWSYDPGLKLSTIASVGFVLSHDETALVICQGVGHDGQGVLNELSIPTGCVLLIDHPVVEDITPFQSPEPPELHGHE